MHTTKPVLALFLLIFVLLLPVALAIYYWQNDEWVYYPNVQQLLNGNFHLNPLTAPTFYSTGILAAGFSLLFGLEKLPVLTLAVSVGCGYLLYLLLHNRAGQNQADSLILAGLFMANPLFVFTSWGFMTDNYFLFFLLLALFFLSDETLLTDNLSAKAKLNLVLGNFFAVCAYFTRQLGMLMPLALALWFLGNKKYKRALIEFGFFILIAVYHFFLFPKSSESLETKFVLTNLTHIRYGFSLGLAVLTYVSLFSLPLLLPKIILTEIKNRKVIAVLLTSIYVLIFALVYSKSTGWVGEKLFYLKYTVQRDGFFTENLHGHKIGIDGADLFYQALDFLAKILGIGLLSYILIFNKFKRILNPSLILLILYTASLFLTVKVYDRYLIPIFPLFIIAVVNVLTIKRKLLIAFTALLFVYSYNFSADYILTNNYVWNKSAELSNKYNVNRYTITATDAWRYIYPGKNPSYKFTYDNPSMQDYATNWNLVETYKIDYPFKLLDNKIYLYNRK